MHYHWQVLVKAVDADDAESTATSVIENEVGDGCFDWFEVGGRWAGSDTKGKNIKNAVNALKHKEEFWKRLSDAEEYQRSALKEAVQGLRRELRNKRLTLDKFLKNPESPEDKHSLLGHYLHKIGMLKAGYYCSESFIATEGSIWGSPNVPKDVRKAIEKNPEEYWLVSMDLHN